MASQKLLYTDILGVPVSAVCLESAMDTIAGWVDRKESRYICVPDASGLVRARKDVALMEALQGADMVTPDGMPSVWASRMRGAEQTGRVTGLDLLPQLCARSASSGWRHYFYGGAEGIAKEAARRLAENSPGMIVAGSYCPPFRVLSVSEERGIIARINAARPDIVWVGLGLPAQEMWCARHVGKIGGATLVGIGFALDVAAGHKTRAPLWMQKSGLEWLYRVITEPGRLWKRYLVTVPVFLWRVTIEQAKFFIRKRIRYPGARHIND